MFAGLILSIASCIPATAEGSAVEAVADEACQKFADGVRLREDPDAARAEFAKSASLFEKLREHGVENTAVYRNMGNAYVLAGDLPHGVLAYRRGLRLDPADSDLRNNLEAARDEVNYAGAGSRRPRVRASGAWSTVFMGTAFALYSLGCVGLTRWLMNRRVSFLAFSVASLVGACALTDAAQRRMPTERTPLAVVADDGVLLRRGDGLAYPLRSETPLNRGVEVQVLTRRRDWAQVELEDGQVGWVPRPYLVFDDE